MEYTFDQLKELIQSMAGYIVIYEVIDGSFHPLLYTDSVPSFSGLTDEEYLGLYSKDAAAVIPSSDLPDVTAKLNKLIAGEGDQEAVYRTFHKTKGFVWTHVFFKLIGTYHSNPIFIGNFSDASEATKSSELLLDNSSQRIYVIEKDTNDLLYANHVAVETKHRAPNLGQKCYEYIRSQKSPCDDCIMRQQTGHKAMNAIWQDRQKSYNIKSVPMTFHGKDANSLFIDDLTEHINLEKQLKQEQERYRAATEGAELRVYEYNIQTHTITLPEHAQKLFGVPSSVIPDIPDAILPEFHAEDHERVRRFFDRVNKGERTVSDSFQMQPVNGYAAMLHYTFTTVYDANGVPVKAYAVAEDITAQKRAEDDFNETIHAILSANPSALCAYKLNLTRNLCDEEHGTSEYVQKVLRADTADGLFENLLAIIPNSKQHQDAEAFFDRRKLLQTFEQGNKSLELDYQRFDGTHNIIWVRTFVNMLKDPDKNEVIAVFYSLNVTKEKRSNEIFNIITNQEYDVVALMYPDMRKIEFLSINGKLPKKYIDAFGKAGYLYDFDESRMFAVNNWIDQVDKEEYLKNSTIEKIKEQLDKNGHHELSVRGHYSGHPEESMCRKIQHYYLDEEKNAILIIQSDVTATYLLQKKETARAKAEAHQMEDIFNRLPVGICVLNMPDPEHVYTSFCNEQQYRLLGLDLQGKSAEVNPDYAKLIHEYFQDEFSGVHPDDQERVHELYRNGYYQQKFSTPNIRFMSGNGEYKYLTTELVQREIKGNEHIFYAVYRDVSEEVALQKMLEKQRQIQMEQKLVNMIGSLPANYVLYRENENGNLTAERYSDEFCQMKGYTQENIFALNGVDGYAPIHPDDRPAVAEALRTSRNDNLLHHAEYRIKICGGKYKWVSVNYSHVNIGAQKYVYAVYTDIDELKKQEHQLEEQYNTALAYLNSVAATYFATQRVNLTKNKVESIGGLDPLQLKKQSVDYDVSTQMLINNMPREEDRKKCAKLFARESLINDFKNGNRSRVIEYMLGLPDRSVHWLSQNITLAKRPDAEDIISFAAIRDISTERFTREIMEQIVSKKLDYICCISAVTGKVVLFFSGLNNAALNNIKQGADYNEVMTAYNNLYVSSQERNKCTEFMTLDNIRYALAQTDHASGVFSYDENNGMRIAQVEFFWLDRENHLIVLTRTDITEAQRQQVEHEKALNAALASTEQANRAKTDFLSRMSHDIRTPLNGIIGMTYLSKMEEDPAKIRANLDKIDTSSQFLLGLINDVLDMSKAESGKIQLHLEAYPPQEFMAYIDAVVRPLVAERNQTIDCGISLPDGMVPILDKLRTNQVFFNLLSNAVKYTPEGGHIKFIGKGEVLDEKRMVMHVEVSDNGIGMSDEFQKVIFEPFSQEGRNDISAQRGTGLGMAITKELVNLMGGTIRVESAMGKGSSFYVDLPAEITIMQTDHGTVSSDIEHAASINTVLAGKHVLLCEDHPLNQEIAKSLLAEKKILVSTAEDGQIGVEMFRDSIPGYYNAVLMDIRMPVMDGYEAVRQIRHMDRSDAKTVPIIAMTADAFSDDVQKCIDAGMNGHVAKPIEPAVLYQTLYKAMKK